MTQSDDTEVQAVDAMLSTVQREPVPEALMQRVTADALRLQPQPVVRPLRRRLFDGWQMAGGLVAASCVGFWIGVSPPGGMPDVGEIVWGDAALQAEVFDSVLAGLELSLLEEISDGG